MVSEPPTGVVIRVIGLAAASRRCVRAVDRRTALRIAGHAGRRSYPRPDGIAVIPAALLVRPGFNDGVSPLRFAQEVCADAETSAELRSALLKHQERPSQDQLLVDDARAAGRSGDTHDNDGGIVLKGFSRAVDDCLLDGHRGAGSG